MQIDIDPTIDKLDKILDGLLAMLPNIIIASTVFIVLLFVGRVLRRVVRGGVERSGSGAYAGVILGRLIQWITVIFGGLVAVSILFPSMDAATLIGILGLGSLAIGFAFRDIAENFLAGILILITRPFKIGDQIVVNDFEGTVQDIQTRATTILTYDGRVVVIPNADFLTNSVVVNTANPIRRSEFDVGISYGDDIGRAKELILRAMESCDEVLREPAPDVLTVELAESSVNLRVRWWSVSLRSDVIHSSDAVITAVKTRLDAGGIEIPFPIRTLYISNGRQEAVTTEPSPR